MDCSTPYLFLSIPPLFLGQIAYPSFRHDLGPFQSNPRHVTFVSVMLARYGLPYNPSQNTGTMLCDNVSRLYRDLSGVSLSLHRMHDTKIMKHVLIVLIQTFCRRCTLSNGQPTTTRSSSVSPRMHVSAKWLNCLACV